MAPATSTYGSAPMATVDISERSCARAASADEEEVVAPLRRDSNRRAYVRLLVGTCASVALVVATGSGAARGSAAVAGATDAGGARGISPAAASEFRAAGDVEYDSTDLYKWFNMTDPEQKLVCNIGYKVLKNCMIPSEFDDVGMLIACEQHGWSAYKAFCAGVDFSGNATTSSADSADSNVDSADSESAAPAETATTAETTGPTLVEASSTHTSAFAALSLLEEKAAQWRAAAPEEREAHRRLHGVAHAFICSEINTGYGVCLDHEESFDGMSCDTWSTAIYEFMCIDDAVNTINGNH